MRITKRNNDLQAFSLNKIKRALLMAFSWREVPDVGPLVQAVARRLENRDTDVATVQDTIESVLMDGGWHKTARRFVLYRAERDAARAARLTPDNAAIAEYIHKAKYALPGEGYADTVERVMAMHIKRYPELEEEIVSNFKFVFAKQVLPSMRAMQFGGAAVEAHHARQYNCSFTHINRWKAFAESFYLLLCGCGVGYSVQWHHVESLSALKRINKRKVYHHTVADTIEGWANALDDLITSYVRGLGYVEFNYSEIRHEGEVLRTSGGIAPGHLELKNRLEEIRSTLDRAQGRKLRPIECHDMLCHVAEAVLSGGVRRSSLICLFSPHDTEMLYSKAAGEYGSGLNPQRAMANNSAVLLRGATDRSIFNRVIKVAQENYGDPGFYWTNSLEYGCNPCGEAGFYPVSEGLSGFQFCNLTEINCGVGDLVASAKAASFIGTLQAGYTEFPYLGPVTEAITRRDALLGVGLTGIMDVPEKLFGTGVLRTMAEAAVEENKRVAALIGVNPGARVTIVKPSGTASLLLGGVASGVHPHHSRRYFRRVTVNRNEAAGEYFKLINPHMIEEKPNGDYVIVFCCQVPDGAATVKEMSAEEFLSRVFEVYQEWIIPGSLTYPELSHNVSCTVTVRDGELEEIIDLVWENQDRIGALSFVPYLIDKKFAFAPREEVTDEDRWNKLIKLYRPVDWGAFDGGRSVSLEPACAGGVCDI